MELERVLQFYKARTAGNGRSLDDPYAVVRFILNQEHPDWQGDRGFEPEGNPEAPPWGYGDYAKTPQGIGAVATDTLMDTAVGILEEEGFSNTAFRRIHQLYTNSQPKKQEKFMELSKDVTLQKISPDLARFLASAAGWAMSDTFTEAPRGRMTIQYVLGVEHLVDKGHLTQNGNVLYDKKKCEKSNANENANVMKIGVSKPLHDVKCGNLKDIRLLTRLMSSGATSLRKIMPLFPLVRA